MSEKTVPGRCYCGHVRFRVTFPSRFFAHCHCHNCQDAHGAAFVTWVGVPPNDQLSFEAGEEHLTRFKTPTGATRSFCKACGTTLFYESPRWAGETHITRVSLKGEMDREPGGHAYFDRHVPWFEFSDSLKRFGGESGMEPL